MYIFNYFFPSLDSESQKKSHFEYKNQFKYNSDFISFIPRCFKRFSSISIMIAIKVKSGGKSHFFHKIPHKKKHQSPQHNKIIIFTASNSFLFTTICLHEKKTDFFPFVRCKSYRDFVNPHQEFIATRHARRVEWKITQVMLQKRRQHRVEECSRCSENFKFPTTAQTRRMEWKNPSHRSQKLKYDFLALWFMIACEKLRRRFFLLFLLPLL